MTGGAAATLPAPVLPMIEVPPPAVSLFLDFDGTLAPIVAEPADARPLAGVGGDDGVLARLAARLGTTAVVSGRPVAFLRAAVGDLPGVRLAGLYGLEEVGPGGEVVVVPGAERWRPVVAEVVDRLRAEVPEGVGIEPKGLSVALHWRRHPEVGDLAMAAAGAETARTGLVAQPGRMAVELRPPVTDDKGTVVERLARGHRVAAYFGDDLGDLPAFAALDRLAAAGLSVVRVAVADVGSPPEMAAAADVVVRGPTGVLRLLGDLLAALGER